MPPSDTDDDARKAAKGRVERLSVPGVPGLRLPPRPRADPEITPPEPYVAERRAREQTRTDWPAVAPVAPRGQPVVSTPVPGERRGSPPPRSVSPVPSSFPAKVEIGDVKVEFRSRHLRGLWIWAGPVVVTIATSAYGYIKGYAKGLSDAAERVAKLEGTVSSLASAVASSNAAIAQSMQGLQSSVNRDGALYNDHDQRMLRIEKEVDTATNRIDSLARTKPIIVKPSQ